MKNIVFDHVVKAYDKNVIVKDLNMEIREGERLILLGPSGCGKSTTLRMIAGLEKLSGGQLYMDGRLVNDVTCGERNVSMVFQNYALFPHMNVEQNIGYSLKIRKRPKTEIRGEVQKMLSLVQLTGYEKRMPSELSGGQRQRVAIARSLINRPQLLLLDEPLGALDLQLRRQMQQELKRLQKKLGITFIYITHDQEEALNMSDRIAVMMDGRFQQLGTPSEVYDSPKTAYVARFVGSANIVYGAVECVEGELVRFTSTDGSGVFHCRGNRFEPGRPVTLAVRGEQAVLTKEFEKGSRGLFGTVKEKSFAGGMLRIAVSLHNDLEFICSRHGIDSELVPGDRVRISWEPQNACPVDLDGEERI